MVIKVMKTEVLVIKVLVAGCRKVLDPGIQYPRHKTFSEAQIWLIKRKMPFLLLSEVQDHISEAQVPISEEQVPLSEEQVPPSKAQVSPSEAQVPSSEAL